VNGVQKARFARKRIFDNQVEVAESAKRIAQAVRPDAMLEGL
jgi:hypothetical protein